MPQHLRLRLIGERGVTAIEYAILASLIAVVIVGAVTTLGTNVRDLLYQPVVNAFN
jgi:pilus assembly protein Flp/PilA